MKSKTKVRAGGVKNYSEIMNHNQTVARKKAKRLHLNVVRTNVKAGAARDMKRGARHNHNQTVVLRRRRLAVRSGLRAGAPSESRFYTIR